MADYMLTTVDNPFNPWLQWDEWLAFDEQQGYYTNALLARMTVTSEELSDVDQGLDIDEAVDRILEMDYLGNYVKKFQTG